MIEYDNEPVRGLPGPLPEGETMLWQGAPDWRMLARAAFHIRAVAIYFVLLAAIGLASGSIVGAGLTLVVGAACIALLHGLAWAIARTTVYTLTDKRIVLRIGVALPKCLNLPLKLMTAADLRVLPAGHGDIALAMGSNFRFGYLLLWPHARPWRVSRPQPMLRALPDAADVAERIAAACAGRAPIGRGAVAEPAATTRDPAPMVAAA